MGHWSTTSFKYLFFRVGVDPEDEDFEDETSFQPVCSSVGLFIAITTAGRANKIHVDFDKTFFSHFFRVQSELFSLVSSVKG